MKPQTVLSQFSVPHVWHVYDIMGRLLFHYDPIQNAITHKVSRLRTIVRINQITEPGMVRGVDGRILFAYDPNTETVQVKNGRLLTDVNLHELRRSYMSFRALVSSSSRQR